jgi:hypothetical protein
MRGGKSPEDMVLALMNSLSVTSRDFELERPRSAAGPLSGQDTLNNRHAAPVC